MTTSTTLQRFPEGQVPTCSAPEHLALVDAAFTRPGGPEAKTMQERLCAHCPVARGCLHEAMVRGEAGVWGGTSTNLRTRHGAPRWRTD